jgi:imidazolonepropionase-like amidohydrolase
LGAQQDRQGTEFALRAQVFEPAEILAQATSINAQLLRMDDRIGRVAEGLIADLIVVDGDPLADVTLFDQGGASLSVIMQGGRLHKRTL